MDRNTTVAQIASAFAGVGRDPEQTLHQAQLADRGMSSRPASGTEWRLGGLLDSEVSWTEVDGAALDECDAALSHLLPISWRFYLPAYMCRSLSLFVAPKFDSKMLRSVMFHLTLPAESGSRGYAKERYETLDTRQRAAVRSFLEFVQEEALRVVEATNRHCGEYDDAKLALESYWHKDACET
jgi:hypothetical protein